MSRFKLIFIISVTLICLNVTASFGNEVEAKKFDVTNQVSLILGTSAALYGFGLDKLYLGFMVYPELTVIIKKSFIDPF